jgi:hypothetical protein
MSPAEVVDKQLSAYNARDAASFASAYAEDVHVFLMPNLKLAVRGRPALQAHYSTNVFCKEGLRAEVISRMAVGNKVVDHEVTHGLAPNPVESVVVYEVVDELIQAVWFFWPNARLQPASEA